MNLAPLTSAPLSVQLHAYAALVAFGLGVVQLMRPKGTTATVRWARLRAPLVTSARCRYMSAR